MRTLMVAVGLASTAVVLAVFSGPIRVRPRVTTPPPATVSQPSRALSGSNQPATAEQAKPNYEGPLGDFIVGIHQGASNPPCPEPISAAKNDKIRASDLYSPVFGDNLEGFVAECGNGLIRSIVIYGPEVLGRAYFVGKLVVTFQAPLDRLKLLTVAGRPALAQLPDWPRDPNLSLVVIERFPSGNRFGIFSGISNTFKTLDEATELAKKIMGVRQ